MSFYSDSSQEDQEDDYMPRKRRKRTKEEQMLGSDSEDDRSTRLDRKTFHNRGVSFQKAHHHLSSESEEDINAPSRVVPSVEFMQLPESLRNSDSAPPNSTLPVFGAYQSNASFSVQNTQMDNDSTGHEYRQREAKRTARADTKDPASAKLMSGRAARMMAKMGYKAGEGLGTTGTGIVRPIEAKLRPGQKAGLGSVDEQTDQAPEDRRHRKIDRSEPRNRAEANKKPKVKYRTSKEIVDESGGGLNIPSGLRSILDLTGGQPKLITDTATFASSSPLTVADTNFRVSQAARHEVEQLALDWKTLQDRKVYLAAELRRTSAEANAAKSNISSLEDLIGRIQIVRLSSTEVYDETTRIRRVTEDVEALQSDMKHAGTERPLDEVAVSLIIQPYKEALASWDVLAQPDLYRKELLGLKDILRLTEIKSKKLSENGKRQSLAFESFMSTVWLPRIRTHIGTSWDPVNSTSVLDFLTSWQGLLPPFLLDQIFDQIVIPRLANRLRAWTPRRARGRHGLSWLFLWLPILGSKATGLVEMIKRQFNIAFAQWNLADGLVPDLQEWRDVIGSGDADAILLKHVHPKLASALRSDFVIDPSDQKLETFEKVFAWRHNFRPAVIGHLFEAEFFPKWLNVLYSWLTGDPNFEEIGQWYEWWQSILPSELASLPAVRKGFAKGIEMMNTTLEHGARSLQPPLVGPQVPVDHFEKRAEKKRVSPQASHRLESMDEQEVSFKDVVEHWCSENDFLLLPTRKSHESGNSLFKIAKSAAGIRGVIIYLRGDIVMMEGQEKGKFSPTSLDDVAVALA